MTEYAVNEVLPDLDQEGGSAVDLGGEVGLMYRDRYEDSSVALDAAEVTALRDWLSLWLERQETDSE